MSWLGCVLRAEGTPEAALTLGPEEGLEQTSTPFCPVSSGARFSPRGTAQLSPLAAEKMPLLGNEEGQQLGRPCAGRGCRS